MLNVNELVGFGVSSQGVTDISYVTNVWADGSAMVVPATAEDGDIALFSASSVSTGTASSMSIPADFILLYNYATTNVNYKIAYKILSASDIGATLITQNNTALTIYRPNGAALLEAVSDGGQDSSGNPSNQTIPSATYTGNLLLEMMLYRHNNVATINRGSTYSDLEITLEGNKSYLRFKKYLKSDTALDNTISLSSGQARRFLGNVLIQIT
tara:strand:- start:322 stop:960 length:639 start_codon:yes stop_codon:yes gene_type:complete